MKKLFELLDGTGLADVETMQEDTFACVIKMLKPLELIDKSRVIIERVIEKAEGQTAKGVKADVLGLLEQEAKQELLKNICCHRVFNTLFDMAESMDDLQYEAAIRFVSNKLFHNPKARSLARIYSYDELSHICVEELWMKLKCVQINYASFFESLIEFTLSKLLRDEGLYCKPLGEVQTMIYGKPLGTDEECSVKVKPREFLECSIESMTYETEEGSLPFELKAPDRTDISLCNLNKVHLQKMFLQLTPEERHLVLTETAGVKSDHYASTALLTDELISVIDELGMQELELQKSSLVSSAEVSKKRYNIRRKLSRKGYLEKYAVNLSERARKGKFVFEL